MSSAPQLYLDDFHIGDRFFGSSREVVQSDFQRFADLTGDAHPIHYDVEYAKQTRFERPLAHGLLLMAWSALGATELSQQVEGSMVAFIEQGCRFTAPVFVGDSIRPEFIVESIDASEGRVGGRLRFAVRMVKGDGTVCFSGFHVYQLLRKPLTGSEAA